LDRPSRKKDKTKRRKRVQTHTHQKVSILSFSLKLKIEEIFEGDYDCIIENYYYKEGERFYFIFENLWNMERRGRLALV